MITAETRSYVARIVNKLVWDASEHEDIIQDVLMRAIKPAPTQYKFNSWLWVLTKQIVIDRHRHNTRQGAIPETIPMVYEPGVERSATARLEIEELLRGFKPKDALMIWQHYAEGMTMQEIAESRGVSEGVVRGRFRVLRAQLTP